LLVEVLERALANLAKIRIGSEVFFQDILEGSDQPIYRGARYIWHIHRHSGMHTYILTQCCFA